MKTESLLQRARGGLLSPIVRAMNSIEEIIQSSDQDRDKLLDMVQHRNWEPYDRSVDVLVGRLRNKIETNPQKPELIKSVRGAGYV